MYIEKTKQGTFKFVERFKDPLTGKDRRVSVTMEKNTAQTRRIAAKTLAAKMEARASVILSPQSATVGELIAAYRNGQKAELTLSTQERNRYAMIYWEQLLGKDTKISILPQLDILGMMQKKKEKPGTMNERLTRFKAMIRWGYAAGIVESAEFLNRLRPFRTPPHKESIADKYLERDDYKRLIPMLSVERWRMLVELMVLSGMRFGEAAALETADVDLRERVIHVTKTWDVVNGVATHAKTYDSIRDIYMQPQLYDVCQEIHAYMLRRRLAAKGGKIFMVDDDGGHLHYGAFRKYLKENTAKYCGHEITPHALRHTAASMMFAQGFSEAEVARRLGHSSSKITKDIYIHITDELRERDARHLDSFVI